MSLVGRVKAWWHRSRIEGFWARVSEGMTLQQLWTQFRRDAGTSYRLYTKELDAGLSTRGDVKSRLRLLRDLFMAMLLKLSPPRRLFLLLALINVLVGFTPERHYWGFVGALMLIVLLGLELADRVAMKRDLEIARDIQRWLVPRTPPAEPGVDIAFTTRPANTVAGDFYDAFRCPASAGAGAARRFVLVVADVAGKGMPAALLMATFQSSLRTLVQEAIPLGELLTRLNRYSCEHSLEGRRFTTAVIAELDPASGTLTYVNAGHNPPALLRSTGAVEWLESGGLPLGIQAEAEYRPGTLTLDPGDRLMVYTDGVVEARNAREEEFGLARLTDCLRDGRGADSAGALARLMASLEEFVGGSGRDDDITCMVVSYSRP